MIIKIRKGDIVTAQGWRWGWINRDIKGRIVSVETRNKSLKGLDRIDELQGFIDQRKNIARD